MAKKRKATKRRHSRRRVSGLKNFDGMGLLLVAAGGVGSRVLTNTLAKQTNATVLKLAPYAAVIAGIVLPMVSKNPMLQKVSVGLIGGGIVSALGPTGLKVITGMDQTIAWASDYNMGVGYPAYRPLPFRKAAGVGANSSGRTPTKSNFSGSRMSQIHTIAGMNPGSGGGGANPMG